MGSGMERRSTEGMRAGTRGMETGRMGRVSIGIEKARMGITRPITIAKTLTITNRTISRRGATSSSPHRHTRVMIIVKRRTSISRTLVRARRRNLMPSLLFWNKKLIRPSSRSASLERKKKWRTRMSMSIISRTQTTEKLITTSMKLQKLKTK
jgi:hypothetical protein